VMPYHYQGEDKTLVGTTETLYQGRADDVKALPEEIDYLLNVYKKYFNQRDAVKVIDHFAGLRVLVKENSSMFLRPRDTRLHWAMPGMLSLYGGKLTAYRSTADLVIRKIKSLLPARRRLADTKQLYLVKEE
jgi:glycerol-3-phosphate dehydrogenase